jgi:hypothetical protein
MTSVPLSKTAPYARTALWIFLTFCLFYIGITRGHFISIDEVGPYQTTRSLWEEKNLTTGMIPRSYPGRNDRYYSQFNPGQSVAAMPLYGLGKAFGQVLKNLNRTDWIAILAGPSLGQNPMRWGGDIEIFFVNLLNCFITALLCTIFFSFSLRLGATPRWALLSSILLGLTTFIGSFSTGFWLHASEALFLLWAFYFLFLDSQRPDWRFRFIAGILTGLMILFRLPSVVAIPGLGLYLLGSIWQRQRKETGIHFSFVNIFGQTVAFAIPVIVGILIYLCINYIKFESILGKYENAGFHGRLLKALYAYLFSPGESIFLFSPLLILFPWLHRGFAKKYRLESIIILTISLCYLMFYGNYGGWHGLYCFGPRYLVPLVPILLLPLGQWMADTNKKMWFVVGFLAVIGFWVQLVNVAVNWWYVTLYENYLNFEPEHSFLFIPDVAQVVTHSKALLAGDYRVDMWLVNVYRMFGLGRLMIIVIPLLTLLLFCVWRLWQSLRQAEAAYDGGIEIRFIFPFRYVFSFLVFLTICMIVPMLMNYS